MAIREIIESDISGQPRAKAVRFGVEGTWYEIHLTESERKEMQKLLKGYLDVARKAPPAQKRKIVPDTTVEEREAIRAWARDQGFEFAERGRLPKKIQAAYDEAHGITREI